MNTYRLIWGPTGQCIAAVARAAGYRGRMVWVSHSL